jgi:gliding motility-associated-like protein
MTKIKITITFFFVFLSLFGLQAQEQFERLYRSTNWENIGLDIVQTGDMGYLLFSIGKHPDSTMYKHANVTKLEPKGDIQWSKSYEFDTEIILDGELTLLANDSFAFSVLYDTLITNKVVVVADPTGEVVWSTKLGEITPTGTGDLIMTLDGGLALFDAASNQPTGALPMMSRLDTAGNLLWTNTYNGNFGITAFDQPSFDAKSTLENGFILGGAASELVSTNAYLMNLDSLGGVNWSKRYNLGVGNLSSTVFRSVESTLDSGYVAGGTFTNTFQQTSGWVIKVDSIGRVLWSHIINDPTLLVPNNVFINAVVPQNDGTVNVLGIHNIPSTFSSRSFVLNLSPDGTINWQNYFFENQDIQVNTNLNLDNLISTQDGGNVAYGHILENDILDGTFIPYVLKIDQNGESSCQDTSSFISGSVSVQVDSVSVFVDSTLSIFDTVEVEAETYGRFSVPVLSLDAPSFCEGEPILHTFDATVPGAVSYNWSTGDTTAMITVMEEGMYTVEVRVEEDICYTMCDTTMITIIGPPTAEIVPNFDGYCSTGFVILQAQGGGTFEWSTGAIEPIILVDELGTYSVTVTNQCGSSSASVGIDEFPVAPEISISSNTNNFCEDGVAIISVNGADNASAITWSPTNEIGSFIQVSDLTPVYSVLADFGVCGTATTEVQLQQPVVDLSIVVNLDSFCIGGNATLTAAANNANNFEWSTGETTPSIMVSEPGTYVVTAVSEFCDNIISEADITPCVSEFDCVQIPNAFTPDNDDTNETFYPVIPEECGDIQVTSMKIYSRWGELVFDSTDPNQRWDGTYNDEPAASDVYVYAISFVNGIGERGTRSGDITLLR